MLQMFRISVDVFFHICGRPKKCNKLISGGLGNSFPGREAKGLRACVIMFHGARGLPTPLLVVVKKVELLNIIDI